MKKAQEQQQEECLASEVPKVLTIQLQRFVVEKDVPQGYRKLYHLISYPPVLNMKHFTRQAEEEATSCAKHVQIQPKKVKKEGFSQERVQEMMGITPFPSGHVVLSTSQPMGPTAAITTAAAAFADSDKSSAGKRKRKVFETHNKMTGSFDSHCEDLLEYEDKSHLYRLKSVVLHLGSTPDSGNYVTYVRRNNE
jgi:hypothetical protein